MAKCENIEIPLTLSVEEAIALHALLGDMTESPKSDPDWALDRIFHALDAAGVDSPELDVDGWDRRVGNGAYVRWAK